MPGKKSQKGGKTKKKAAGGGKKTVCTTTNLRCQVAKKGKATTMKSKLAKEVPLDIEVNMDAAYDMKHRSRPKGENWNFSRMASRGLSGDNMTKITSKTRKIRTSGGGVRYITEYVGDVEGRDPAEIASKAADGGDRAGVFAAGRGGGMNRVVVGGPGAGGAMQNSIGNLLNNIDSDYSRASSALSDARSEFMGDGYNPPGGGINRGIGNTEGSAFARWQEALGNDNGSDLTSRTENAGSTVSTQRSSREWRAGQIAEFEKQTGTDFEDSLRGPGGVLYKGVVDYINRQQQLFGDEDSQVQPDEEGYDDNAEEKGEPFQEEEKEATPAKRGGSVVAPTMTIDRSFSFTNPVRLDEDELEVIAHSLVSLRKGSGGPSEPGPRRRSRRSLDDQLDRDEAAGMGARAPASPAAAAPSFDLGLELGLDAFVNISDGTQSSVIVSPAANVFRDPLAVVPPLGALVGGSPAQRQLGPLQAERRRVNDSFAALASQMAQEAANAQEQRREDFFRAAEAESKSGNVRQRWSKKK